MHRIFIYWRLRTPQGDMFLFLPSLPLNQGIWEEAWHRCGMWLATCPSQDPRCWPMSPPCSHVGRELQHSVTVTAQYGCEGPGSQLGAGLPEVDAHILVVWKPGAVGRLSPIHFADGHDHLLHAQDGGQQDRLRGCQFLEMPGSNLPTPVAMISTV